MKYNIKKKYYSLIYLFVLKITMLIYALKTSNFYKTKTIIVILHRSYYENDAFTITKNIF